MALRLLSNSTLPGNHSIVLLLRWPARAARPPARLLLLPGVSLHPSLGDLRFSGIATADSGPVCWLQGRHSSALRFVGSPQPLRPFAPAQWTISTLRHREPPMSDALLPSRPRAPTLVLRGL